MAFKLSSTTKHPRPNADRPAGRAALSGAVPAATGRPTISNGVIRRLHRAAGALRTHQGRHAAGGRRCAGGQEAGSPSARTWPMPAPWCPTSRCAKSTGRCCEAAFADFADWHSNASPHGLGADRYAAPIGDLVLDITGVSHLFGGETGDAAHPGHCACGALGYTVDGAVASTIGAAWAVSHFARSQVVPAATDRRPFWSSLPVAALRLSPMQVAGLTQMGLKQIGQLQAARPQGFAGPVRAVADHSGSTRPMGLPRSA